jgi:hypothetical protein
MSSGPTVVRLLTFVDVVEAGRDRLSLSARHEAVLADGRHVLLLDDRGWTSSGDRGWTSSGDRGWTGSGEASDFGAALSIEEVEREARFVVGPDEPVEGRSQEEEAALHWGTLAEKLRREGIDIGASDLRRLPHDVVLSERARALCRPRRETPPATDSPGRGADR